MVNTVNGTSFSCAAEAALVSAALNIDNQTDEDKERNRVQFFSTRSRGGNTQRFDKPATHNERRLDLLASIVSN